jgi:glycosyltransferase involved in cell wall biosynthesis
MPNLKFSFIVPTRHRPQQLRRLLGSIIATAVDRSAIEVVLVIDADDDESPTVSFSSLLLKWVKVEPGLPMSALIQAGFDAATAPYVMLLTDDVVIRTPEWDQKVLAVMMSFPDQIVLVHVNDLIFRDTLCTFPLVTREFCRHAGGICPTGYRRYRIDDHIHNVFDLLSTLGVNRRIFVPDVIFEHAHLDAEPDECGLRKYTPAPEIQELDTQIFESLLPDRKHLALTLYEIIGQRRGAARAPAADVLNSVVDSVAIRRREHVRWARLGAGFAGIEGSVTIAVLTENVSSTRARQCIERIKAYTVGYTLVVLECASEPDRLRQRSILSAECQTDYLVLVEDSVLVEPLWLEELIGGLKPDAAIIRPTMGLILIDLAKHAAVDFNMAPLQSCVPAQRLGRVAAEDRNNATPSPVQGSKQEVEYISERSQQRDVLLRRLMKQLKPPDENYPPLFDPVYYLRNNPDVVESGCAPLKHYLAHGAAEGRRFNPLFDEAFYRQRDPGVSGSGNPLLHFLERGAAARHSPHPLFDIDFYLRSNPDVAAAGINPLAHYLDYGGFEGRNPHPLFDSAFYLRRYPALAHARINPLVHFVESGAFQGYWPNPLFESSYYLAQNPDVATTGLNPLVHFLSVGAVEFRRPHLLFDIRYYVTRYLDVLTSGMNPLAHFLSIGGTKGYSPCPLFDSAFYLRKYPDVAAAGLNPLVHFVEKGGRCGHAPNPHFDSQYYLSRNPDVEAAGLNPLVHFIEHGAGEGRNPNPLFNVKAYTVRYPDVKAARVNPLEHFLCHGISEQRNPSVTGGLQSYLASVDEPATAKHRPIDIHIRQHLAPVSVVIPTRNRSSLLEQLLEVCRLYTGDCDLEFVVVDDGSTDDTASQLQRLSASMSNLTWRSIAKSGPGRARNVGVDIARHDLILFIGDDIHPANEDFFRVHARLHAACQAVDFAVLGKVDWAGEPTFTMTHIQGRGSEQFDYAHLRPYTISDWRHFYTSNLSVKKAIVSDWMLHGFDPEFPGAAVEDIELGYRIAKSSTGLRVFYDPGSVGLHHHHYTLAQFMQRQFFAGKATRLFYDRHPELVAGPFRGCVDVVEMSFPVGTQLPDQWSAAIEAVKAWARILEMEGSLGQAPWHDDLLTAVLELCALEGFVSTWTLAQPNLVAARAVMLDRLVEQLGPTIQQYVADWSLLQSMLPPAGADLLRMVRANKR